MKIADVLKWLAAVASAGALAALKSIIAGISGAAPAGVDTVVAIVIAALVVKGANWLIGKLPVDA